MPLVCFIFIQHCIISTCVFKTQLKRMNNKTYQHIKTQVKLDAHVI